MLKNRKTKNLHILVTENDITKISTYLNSRRFKCLILTFIDKKQNFNFLVVKGLILSKKLIFTVGIAVPENHVRQYPEKGPWRPGPNFRWPNEQRFTKGKQQTYRLGQTAFDRYTWAVYSVPEGGIFCNVGKITDIFLECYFLANVLFTG